MQTIGRTKEELKAIDSRLVEEYKIEPYNCGVKLIRKETVITSQKTNSETALYEIEPKVNNRGFRELYGAKEDVARNLSLKEAIMIAELTSGSLYIPDLVPLNADLNAIAKLCFGDGQNKITKQEIPFSH
ncbi:hypothetical protein HYU07_06785 [Candidatus Woesearchaeota archaeon]|nr:hypothetical protein [Candidatus Woesearchaeota archaeon]